MGPPVSNLVAWPWTTEQPLFEPASIFFFSFFLFLLLPLGSEFGMSPIGFYDNLLRPNFIQPSIPSTDWEGTGSFPAILRYKACTQDQ